MTRPSEVLARPLFYDALSGEFTPPSDPLERSHTLGRLAYGSIQKGDEVFDMPARLSDSGFRAYRYVPSWARMVESTTIVDVSGRYPILSALNLLHGTSTLATQDVTRSENTPQVELSLDGDVVFYMSLELGESIAKARLKIASAAQGFFNQVRE